MTEKKTVVRRSVVTTEQFFEIIIMTDNIKSSIDMHLLRRLHRLMIFCHSI